MQCPSHHHHRHSFSKTCGRLNASNLLLHRLSSPARCIPLPPAHIAAVSDLKFIGEKHMVSADVIGRLYLWDYHAPRAPVVATWSGHTDCINSIAAGNEGKFVTAGNDKVLRVWDISQGKEVQELQGHVSFVLNCDLSSSSQLMASVSLDSTLRLWHASSPIPVFTAALPVAASCVRFIEGECTLLLTSGSDGVFLWDIRRHPSYQLLVSPPSPAVYRDTVWDATPTRPHTRPTPLSLSPTNLISTSSLSPVPLNPSSFVTPAKRPPTQQKFTPTSTPHKEPSYPFWQISWSSPAPAPRTNSESTKFTPIAQLYNKNKAINQKKFDKTTQHYVQLFSGHAAPAYAAISSHTGRHAITASSDSKLKLWDLPTQQGMYTFAGCSLTSSGPIPCISGDDKTLICGSSNGSVHFWSTLSGADETADNSVAAVPTHDHPITCLSLSSDDATIASGDDSGTIKLRTANNCILSQYKDPD